MHVGVSKLLVARIVVGTIILQIAGMLLNYTLNTYVVSEAAVGKVHTETFVPYLMAALGIIGLSCTIRRNEVHRTKWVLLACVAIAFFAMSLRTINFYAADGEIYETTPIVDIDGGTLDGLNDETYCYQRNFPFIDLRPSRYGKTHRFLDGLWPSNFTDASLKTGFFGAVKPCSGSSRD